MALRNSGILVPEWSLFMDDFTDTSKQCVFSGNNSQTSPPLLLF